MRCAAVSRAPPTAWRVTTGSRERRGRGRCVRRVPVARWVAIPSGPGGSRCALTGAHECDAPSPSRPARLKHRSIGGSSASTRDTLHPRLRSHARATTRRATTRTKASSDETDGRETKSDDDNAGDGERSLDGAIFALALPAVASLLLDPVLGVVDTAFVGRIQGEGAAEALGGLAVSTAVFNFSFKLFNFLAEVTGPLVASQIAAAKAEESENRYDDRYDTRSTTRVQAAETVRGAMTVAVVLGVSACLALEFGAENVLRWSGGDGLASSTGVDGSGMMHQAEMYLRVRALSAPAALIGTVAVGAYRGLLDTKTPLLVSGAANAVNLGEFIFASVRAIGMMTSCFFHLVLFTVLDPILIFGLGPVPAFGVAGAAAATTAAEWIAAVVFWKMLVDEGLLPRMGQETKNEAEPTKSSEETFGNFVFETGPTNESECAASSPDGITGWFSAMKPLAAGSASQLVRTLILQAVLLRATAEAAGSGAAGAHQICIQVWWVTLFALDALAVAAQSLVASSLGTGDVPRARGAADRCLKWALAAGTAVGVGEFLFIRVWAIGLTACFLTGICAAGPALPGPFTDDAALVESTRGPLRLVAALQPLNAAVFVGDGVLQGAADFDYLATAMAASAASALVLLSRVGSGVETSLAAGADAEVVSATALTGVWQSMSALQLGRAGTLSWRYFFDGKSPVAVGERASKAVGERASKVNTDEAGKENGE